MILCVRSGHTSPHLCSGNGDGLSPFPRSPTTTHLLNFVQSLVLRPRSRILWINFFINKLKYCLEPIDIMGDSCFSIDRIDNALPHIKSNCQMICVNCNVMNLIDSSDVRSASFAASPERRKFILKLYSSN